MCSFRNIAGLVMIGSCALFSEGRVDFGSESPVRITPKMQSNAESHEDPNSTPGDYTFSGTQGSVEIEYGTTPDSGEAVITSNGGEEDTASLEYDPAAQSVITPDDYEVYLQAPPPPP